TWPRRNAGSGQITTVAFTVPEDSLDFWRSRLKKLGVEATRTSRFDTEVLVLQDADGIELELVPRATSLHTVPWPNGPVPAEHAIRGFHSVTMTVAEAGAIIKLLTKTLGFRRGESVGNRTRIENGEEHPDPDLHFDTHIIGKVSAQ